MKKMFGKWFFLISLLSVLMLVLAPAVRADTLLTDEYLVASTSAYETTPTLGNDGTSDLVVYTMRDLLPTNFFDAGDIWYQRLAGGAPLGLPMQVTVGPTDDQLNDVSGDYIVYTAYDSTSSTAGTITLYQISTGKPTPLAYATVIQEPRIHGDKIVWREGSTGATVVMYYELGWIPYAWDPYLMAGPMPPTFTVDIGDRFVVWAEYVSGQYDIAAYDLGSGSRIVITSTAATNEREPSTSGAWITWQAQDQGASTIRIEGINVDTGETRVMVDNGARCYRPSVSGDLVGYESDLAGNMDVFVYRLSTDESFQVTDDASDQYLNDMFTSLMAYVDRRRAGDEDVYVSRLDFVPSEPCEGEGGDTDGDGVCNDNDNCPAVANADQADADGNGIGDACDVPPDPCEGLVCDDGLFCNGVETCVSGICQAGSPVNCDDGVSCTVDTCNEDTDTCVNTPDDAVCADGDLCTDDICDPVLSCSNPPITCPPGEQCDYVTGQCVIPPDPCADLGGDTDGDGVCDDLDNCPSFTNQDQADSDGDGFGDACDVPQIVISPLDYDFGEVEIWSSSTTIFSISNEGTDPLTVTEISMDPGNGSGFQITTDFSLPVTVSDCRKGFNAGTDAKVPPPLVRVMPVKGSFPAEGS